ncbi:MAG: hypothetical protein JXA99_17365, partial [Candidatus Lokiarchaeota archaeon]|nr:hypothetical protein [Candidatus Lokiarchaeota archaeon]
ENENILLKTCVFLLISIYITVIYSTFLTRSGVLSQASVHSFVSSESIVYLFLLLFLLFFLFGGIFVFISRLGSVKTHLINSINFFSRNGLILIGTIFLLFSTLIIFIGTSAPILGISVDTKFYDKMNLPLIIFISIICGASLYFRGDMKPIFKKIFMPFIVSIIITIIISLIVKFINLSITVFLFSSLFLVIANCQWLFKFLRKFSSRSGAFLSHLGLGLFLIGVLASGIYTKDFNINLIKNNETCLLEYKIKFVGVEQIDNTEKYKLNIEIKEEDKILIASPKIYFNEYANDFYIDPDIISELTQDIYVAPISYDNGEQQESMTYITLTKNDTNEFKQMQIIFESFQFINNSQKSMSEGDSIVIASNLKILHKGKTYSISPVYIAKNNERKSEHEIIEDLNLSFSVIELDALGKIILGVSEISVDKNTRPEQLLAEISIKPFMILIWLGTGLILVGAFISAIKRYNSTKIKNPE